MTSPDQPPGEPAPTAPQDRQEPKVKVDPLLHKARDSPVGEEVLASSTEGDRKKPPGQAAAAGVPSPEATGDQRAERPPVSQKPSSRAQAPAHRDPLAADRDERHSPGWAGPPLWAWILGGLIALAILLLVMDLRNRERYLLVCTHRGLELQQGRRFPWPFGHTPVGGPELKAISRSAAEDCVERTFDSRLEAKEAFLDALLARTRAKLDAAEEATLETMQQDVQQALRLSEKLPHRRREVEQLGALVSYQEGKAGLQRAERALRSALARFQQAQKLAAGRFDDLEQWISHLEEMLRALSPSPFSAPQLLPGPLLPGDQQASTQLSPPGAPAPSSSGSSGAAEPRQLPDAGAPPSGDGALPQGAGGILM